MRNKILNKGCEFSFRHSGLFGFQIMKMNYKGKSNYESVISSPSTILNVVEIPIQSSTDNQLEVLNNDSLIKFLTILDKSNIPFLV